MEAVNVGDGLFQLDTPNLYVAMTRGQTMVLNPSRK
jgi:hypothetical protein